MSTGSEHALALHDAAFALGSTMVTAARVRGGSVTAAWRVGLSDGRAVFVKTDPRAEPDMFQAEADGLAWLAQARAVSVPRVLFVGAAALALEWIDTGPADVGFDAALGVALARLHQAGAPTFGWRRDNHCGTVPQDNRPAETWAEFYAERRIAPLATGLFDAGELPRRIRDDLLTLCRAMEERAGPIEPPALLHGDLWSGNVLCDRGGCPWLIDPAVVGGHREVDLAMWQLFGHASSRFLEAYESVVPLSPGHQERVALWQIYPLLVHVALFGGSYVGALADTLTRVT